MYKILSLVTYILIFSTGNTFSQKKYKLSAEAFVLIKPFNNLTFASELEEELYPFTIQNNLNYQVGLRAARVFKNNEFFIQLYYTQMSARWEYELRSLAGPNIVEVNFERTIDVKGSDFGIGYSRQFGKFKISSAAFANLPFHYKIKPEYDSKITDFGIITTDEFNTVSLNHYYLIEEYNRGVGQINLNFLLGASYNYTSNFSINLAVNLAPWHNGLYFYYLKISGNGQPFGNLPEATPIVNRQLDTNWIYPKIGISYEF